MKQFEKCLEEAGGGDPYCCEPLAEKIWRDALEWILSWETDSESIEIIKRELGDGD